MNSFAIILWFALIPTCFSQLKACYQATDGELAGDFPCNPDANVSSCCASGNICSSNLYCISAGNQQNYVGTCTDKTWSSPACPFNLSPFLLFSPSWSINVNQNRLTVAAFSVRRKIQWFLGQIQLPAQHHAMPGRNSLPVRQQQDLLRRKQRHQGNPLQLQQ